MSTLIQMDTTPVTLVELLERGELATFLTEYEKYCRGPYFDLAKVTIMQSRLSKVLRSRFRAKKVAGSAMAKIWFLAEYEHLLPLDDDLRTVINRWIDELLLSEEKSVTKSLRPRAPVGTRSDASAVGLACRCEPDTTGMRTQSRRMAAVDTFTVQVWHSSGILNSGRSLCDSNQEKEFLRAIRLYFPAMFAYPNVPLQSFIKLEKIGIPVSNSLHRYSRHSRVDVLLCTHEEYPVAGFELDSAWHDRQDARTRDDMKNKLFQLADIPLVRIRPKDPGAVRAADFYDLLIAEKDLNRIRPNLMRS